MNNANPILLVDDEMFTLAGIKNLLAMNGISNVETLQDGRELISQIKHSDPRAIILDLMMPHISGQELLEQIVHEWPDIPVIMLTAFDAKDINMRCILAGAFDFLVKPVQEDRLMSSIKRAEEFWVLRRENRKLKNQSFADRLEHPEAFLPIITRNAEMMSIFRYIEAIAPSINPVLITGQTGTGKELIAKAIHSISRRQGQFIAVNVAGLDDNLFSDTIFGHAKGAFTGADQVRTGLLENAAGGTLFLDEIGDLSPASQVKLLRLLQEKEYFPLGADRPKISDARILAATHKEIQYLQESESFRKDLFYRLNVCHIHLPPLKQRMDDLPLLVDHFLQKASKDAGLPKTRASEQIIEALSEHNFPGNLRELQSLIAEAVSRNKGKDISAESIRASISRNQKLAAKPAAGNLIFPENLPSLKEAIEMLVGEAMKRSLGNQTIAAKMLGISQPALSKRLNKKASLKIAKK